MGYRVLVSGVPIECDTPEEAVEIAKHAGEATGAGQRRQPAQGDRSQEGGSRWTEARVKEFFRLIKGQQKRAIDSLLEHRDGRTDDQLCQLLGLADGRNLAGVLTGLHKNARKVGADPKELYSRQSVTIGDKRQHEYLLSDSFRKAVSTLKT